MNQEPQGAQQHFRRSLRVKVEGFLHVSCSMGSQCPPASHAGNGLHAAPTEGLVSHESVPGAPVLGRWQLQGGSGAGGCLVAQAVRFVLLSRVWGIL